MLYYYEQLNSNTETAKISEDQRSIECLEVRDLVKPFKCHGWSSGQTLNTSALRVLHEKSQFCLVFFFFFFTHHCSRISDQIWTLQCCSHLYCILVLNVMNYMKVQLCTEHVCVCVGGCVWFIHHQAFTYSWQHHGLRLTLCLFVFFLYSLLLKNRT